VALLDGLPVAVLQAGRKVWVASSARTPNVPSVATSRYGAGVPSPKEARLSPTAGRKLSISSRWWTWAMSAVASLTTTPP